MQLKHNLALHILLELYYAICLENISKSFFLVSPTEMVQRRGHKEARFTKSYQIESGLCGLGSRSLRQQGYPTRVDRCVS